MIVWLATSNALACSCVLSPQVLPAADATDVPTNASLVSWFVFFGGVAPYELVLLGPDGEEVPLSPPSGDDYRGEWRRPLEPLEPLTTYTVQLGDWPEHTFTTGLGDDGTPPERPAIVGSDHAHDPFANDGECEPHNRVGLEVGPSSEAHVVYEVQYAHDEAFTEPGSTLERWPEMGWSDGPCGRWIPEAEGRPWWRVRAVDLAGNASDWSEPVREKAPNGCTTAPSGAGGTAASALLALALLRRRRGRA